MAGEGQERRVSSANSLLYARKAARLYLTTFDPAKAVLGLYRRLGTWKAVADELGGDYSPATWNLVARGNPPSRQVENTLRRYFRLPPRGQSSWFDMRTADVAWYLAHRTKVVYGADPVQDKGAGR